LGDKTKGRKGNQSTGGNTQPPQDGRGGHRAAMRPQFLNDAFWGVVWHRAPCLRSSVLSLLGLFCYLSLLGFASTSLFSPKLGSIRANLKSKPEQAKTKYNRRHLGTNRKIMQINPRIESKSLKIPII